MAHGSDAFWEDAVKMGEDHGKNALQAAEPQGILGKRGTHRVLVTDRF